MIRKVEERLAEYRRKNKREIAEEDCQHQFQVIEEHSDCNSADEASPMVCVLNLWHRSYSTHPRLSITSIIFAWFLAQCYFVYIQFGLVFFVISLFICMYVNLGKRTTGELSAYSVFNPSCQQLPGTLTAEHFERDLLKRQRL